MTHYIQIERWWESVSSAYLLVSLPCSGLNSGKAAPQEPFIEKFRAHACWHSSCSWTSRFHNLQLMIQPYVYFCLLKPWLLVFALLLAFYGWQGQPSGD
ncbi:hypothetical protein H6F76_05370 [Leptolyngbya sp. FACHB-321]|uniref:hypothetical protein n=1 Tax=Leptolyngbya sp. FACHB-321 TaxID=2692807 RepID=UPI0016870BF7|nr:hypothetical protein [Leptolyngbya sp. FACHB-321]MBD2034465.1 hypothetical protein [Leptolyngbya sp. FACHB-321]